MKRNLLGELRIMKDYGIKPNYSALQREYGIDRHTIKKYYDNDGIPKRKCRKGFSKWDQYSDECNQILKLGHVSYKALWMFLSYQYGEDKLPGDYNSMRNYFYRKNGRIRKNNRPHVLYETPPGKQAQFDWKEDLQFTLENGQIIHFNVFSLTLGYSREHVFIYSSHKGTDDFLHCFIKAINKIGGICDEYLTDNMSAIVSCRGTNKKINPKVSALFKDIGATLKLCKAKTPQTKGKVENSNKFISWIFPYDGKLKTENDLIELIEDTITADANRQINTGTNMPPAALFEKEKEYLRPLANKVLLDSYLTEHIKQTVPDTLLVGYRGNKYSVGSEYINKIVDIYPVSEELYIYYNSKLIAKHTITHKKVNYDTEHYLEALTLHISGISDADIRKMSDENLKRLSILGKGENHGNDKL